MKRSFTTLFIFLLTFLSVYSQFTIRRQIAPPKPADSLDLSYYGKKNGLKAASMVFGLNMGVWAFDCYIMNEDFARIGINSITDNMKSGFKWDNDQMGTNLFLHPYHGNLYFNAARSNGYNYWESGGFALGGSFMWEMFMENESPSINDIIATPVGGMALGEVFYRASDLVLDDRKRGKSRVGSEIAGFIISPTRGLTRIINGDAWKVRSTSGRQFGIPNVSVDVSAGVRVLELEDEIFDKGVGGAVAVSVEYGDRFECESKSPFDYFSFRAYLDIISSQPILSQLNIIGRLWGVDVVDSKTDYIGFGAYQHFDYYDSDTISSISNRTPYKFATPASAGFGFVHKSKRFKNWSFDSYAHLNAIFLGAALSDHYLVDNRNYNLGSGFGWKLGANIVYKDKVGISWLYEGYRMYTWKGYPDDFDLSDVTDGEWNIQGDKSNATLNTSSLKVDVKLSEQLYLTGIGSMYRRSTHYDNKNYERVYSTTVDGRFMLTYKF